MVKTSILEAIVLEAMNDSRGIVGLSEFIFNELALKQYKHHVFHVLSLNFTDKTEVVSGQVDGWKCDIKTIDSDAKLGTAQRDIDMQTVAVRRDVSSDALFNELFKVMKDAAEKKKDLEHVCFSVSLLRTNINYSELRDKLLSVVDLFGARWVKNKSASIGGIEVLTIFNV